MGSNDARVLVCMPTYHSEQEWLDKSIASLKNQTYPNFDCWIVKDGCRWATSAFYSERTCLECDSCKRTIQYCQNVALSDDRFKFYILPIHLSGAGWGPRNFAILNTSHDLIAYLDDDNWYEPDHLESLVTTINETNADVAYTGTRIWDAAAEQVLFERLKSGIPEEGGIDTSEILHRRYLIDKYGGWRFVPKCNDWDIVKRWTPSAIFAHTGKFTLNFRLRENCGIHRL